jgi:prophage maintenance system killer protein
MGTTLHYLTVQDILWINLQVTKKVHHFNYARLEEATFYQYAYGESNSLVPQAGRFISGFLKMHPFDAGNEATAFVACAAFLKINGQEVNLPDEKAHAWFQRIQSKDVKGADAIAAVVADDPEHHGSLEPNVRAAVKAVLGDYSCTVQALYDPADAASARAC